MAYAATVTVSAYSRAQGKMTHGEHGAEPTKKWTAKGLIGVTYSERRWPRDAQSILCVVDVVGVPVGSDWEGYLTRDMRVRIRPVLVGAGMETDLNFGNLPTFALTGYIDKLYHGERADGGWMPGEAEDARDTLCTVTIEDWYEVPDSDARSRPEEESL